MPILHQDNIAKIILVTFTTLIILAGLNVFTGLPPSPGYSVVASLSLEFTA